MSGRVVHFEIPYDDGDRVRTLTAARGGNSAEYGFSYDVADNFDAEGEPAVGKTLTVTLKYGRNRERSIAGVRRISKPGLRVYAKSTNLPKVLGGLGVAIISTSQGLLTDRQANQKGVGGEVLAYVW